MIIVFEGIDGSGKSTQLQRLKHCLEEVGKDVVTYKFPTHDKTRFGKIIDGYLTGEMEHLPTEVPAVFYAVDRYQFKDKMEKELEEGKLLLIDRYYISNLAHQGGKYRGKERKEMMEWLYSIDSRLPREDVVFVFDITPEKSQDMTQKKNRDSHDRKYLLGKKDKHEEDLEHLKNTREVYLELARKNKWPVINVLDKKGNIRDIEDIHNEVWDKIEAFL